MDARVRVTALAGAGRNQGLASDPNSPKPSGKRPGKSSPLTPALFARIDRSPERSTDSGCVGLRCGVWTKPLARRTLRVRRARSVE